MPTAPGTVVFADATSHHGVPLAAAGGGRWVLLPLEGSAPGVPGRAARAGQSLPSPDGDPDCHRGCTGDQKPRPVVPTVLGEKEKGLSDFPIFTKEKKKCLKDPSAL